MLLNGESRHGWLADYAVPLGIAAATLVFSLLTTTGYGYFRDELYYLACAEHLGFGYVEHPPLIGLIAWVVQHTLGTSLVAIRLLPAVAAAATVFLTGWIARELGGGRLAQALAAVCVALAPGYLGLFSVFSMNAFDMLAWTGAVAIVVWLAGLLFYLVARRGRPWRALGWTFLFVTAVMVTERAKPYYLDPAFPMLFAAGAVAIEAITTGRRLRWIGTALIAVIVVTGAILAPLGKPLLSEDTYVRYSRALGVRPSTDERQRLGRLPQFFADMHGWREMAETVAGVYNQLPAADRERACVFGQDYGQAGAIDLFGPALGLPHAISGHNSYFLWGPRGCDGTVLIVLGDRREVLERLFDSVSLGATFVCRDCMPYEDHLPVWVCRGLRQPVRELWPRVKGYI